MGTTTTHTPGPWTLHLVAGGIDIGGPDSLRIATIVDSIHRDVAANARLIAAAPEGLFVAQAALAWWHADITHFSAQEPAWVQQARDFIQRATGQS